MSNRATRRSFLQTSATGGVALWAGQFGFLNRLPRVSAAEAQMNPGLVRFDNGIEPLVQVIETTSRADLIEVMARKIQQGTSYQEVLAALLLAGVRNVQPRPSVGFKFHAVLVVNSCHLASLAGPDEDRWLPIFWALDNFKGAQADEARQSGWKMAPVDEAKVPDSTKARAEFVDAMNQWDVEKADASIAGLVRTAGAGEVFELLAQYSARDFRSIGHKAIFLANGWRTLQVIGWEFAEPVLRSLTFALLNHSGEPNPAESDLDPDRPWRENEALISRIPDNWLDGKLDPSAPQELFEAQRTAGPHEAAKVAASQLEQGISPQSVWDGVFVGAGELLMRQPGIVGLHGLTTANAINYIYHQTASDELRKRLLLQATSFNCLFRDGARNRGELKDVHVDNVTAAQVEPNAETVERILNHISSDRMEAASEVRGYLQAGGDPGVLTDAARRMIFLKGRDSHDYKYSSAVLEDYHHVSPAWRDQFMALSVFNLKGTGDRNSDLIDRTRDALG